LKPNYDPIFLQCFDPLLVGLFDQQKPVPDMTYNAFGGSFNQLTTAVVGFCKVKSVVIKAFIKK